MPRLPRIAALLAAALAGACARAPSTPPPPDRPDTVVLILIDTLRADWLGAYAPGRGTSPHIDRLAREGVVFEQASSPAPWTLPSVVSLFTSTFPAEHDVTRDGKTLAPELPTLAEHLRELGYATVSVHRNPYAGELSGLERGFDVARLVKRPITGERVRPFLEQAAERPLFLYLHDVQPHDPWRASPAAVARFGEVAPETRTEIAEASNEWRRASRLDFVRGDSRGSTPNGAALSAAGARLDARLDALRALYSGAVADADARVGEVLAELERAGRYEDALILVVADHGEEMGEHGGWQHDQSLYQELVHVPLVARLPGGRRAGTRVAAPVSLVDLAPTVLELCGAAERAADASGRSLVPLFEGDAAEDRPRVVALRLDEKKHYEPFEERRGDRNLALRHGRWKAIWNADPETLELYDLEADPGERRDLAAEEPERAERLAAFAREAFQQLLTRRSAATDRGADAGSGAAREALEELGYVGGDD